MSTCVATHGGLEAAAEPLLPTDQPIRAKAQMALGMACLANNEAAAAIEPLSEAIRLGDRSGPTLLNLALAHAALGRTQQARLLMQQAATEHQAWDEPHLRLAESFRRENNIAPALQAYEHALACNPMRVESLVGSGALLVMQGDGRPAQRLLERAVEADPTQPDAWDALGLAHMLNLNPTCAALAFATARRLAPGRFEIALHAAEAAIANGVAEAEFGNVELAAQTDPQNPLIHAIRGLLLEHFGRRAEAIDALEVAAALAPDAAIPMGLLGGMLARALRLAEAKIALQRALEIDPGNPRVCSDLGAVLMRTHQPAEARVLLQDLLTRIPPQASILCNLANATAGCAKQDEAVSLARKAILLNPQSPLTWRTLLGTLPYAENADGATLLQAARDCARLLPARPPPPVNHTARAGLRIGLLSGSFRTHPVGWLTVAGLETLDPTAFELIFFSQNTGTDPIARRFRTIATEWVDIDGCDDRAVADLILAARVDILIDLGGYGEGGRMAVCALRPAPLQVKWVGMQCHSTGLPTMDWFLSDRWETPPELEQFYSERILRLPDGYVCYSPPPHAPDVAALPALENGAITFGCFNNLAKMTPRVLSTWATILRRLPTSRLVLKSPQLAHAPTAAEILEAMSNNGINPDRISMQGPSRHRTFLADYNKIDIVLDPFPYAGGLTTCEALWMGVPTITLPGETFASRHSYSHLSNVGLQDWAASSVENYVEQAVRRANDLAALSDLRANLRVRVKASPLCDAPRFGRNLGAALKSIWAQHERDQLS